MIYSLSWKKSCLLFEWFLLVNEQHIFYLHVNRPIHLNVRCIKYLCIKQRLKIFYYSIFYSMNLKNYIVNSVNVKIDL